ncbi:MAG: hypothetical protein AAFR73_00175 [Pseudomonadota bacterium]
MTHTPPVLSMSGAALDYFLSLLPAHRVTRDAGQITVHADMGDAIWFARGGRWITSAPGDDTARRFGAQGRRHS